MNTLSFISGRYQMEVVSADPECFLSAVRANGITLDNVVRADPLTVRFYIKKEDTTKLKEIAEKRGEALNVHRKSGAYWHMMSILKRPLFLFGILAFLLMCLYFPSRIFFIEIEGNVHIPQKYILEKAENCGIVFGASRRAVRSEQVKNALLEEIPELQWAGINTYGCIGIITVREKNIQEKENIESAGISSIVASRDGIITDCTVYQGSPMCKVGDAVKSGQLLVSGYTDCGLTIQATQARGEILALTQRELNAVSPTEKVIRVEKLAENKKYSILIGKKLINFYNDSGISSATCVKMYDIKYLTLPGGFRLPLALVTEVCADYDVQLADDLVEQSYEWMLSASEAYLQNQMIAGQVLQSEVELSVEDGTAKSQGIYNCQEMIGQIKKEELIIFNGKDE